MQIQVNTLQAAIAATVAALKADPTFLYAYTDAAELPAREARIVIRDTLRRLNMGNPYDNAEFDEVAESDALSGPKQRELLRRDIDRSMGIRTRPGVNKYADVQSLLG